MHQASCLLLCDPVTNTEVQLSIHFVPGKSPVIWCSLTQIGQVVLTLLIEHFHEFSETDRLRVCFSKRFWRRTNILC
jgi:hypothetical protein